MLDVGAISPNNYHKESSWIETVAIDLNPQAEGITKADFLTYETDTKFNIVCLSLVLNFLGDPKDRGSLVYSYLTFA